MNAVLDALYVACADLDACRGYERLGLSLTPPANGARMLHVGLGNRQFRVHFLAEATAWPLLEAPLAAARASGQAAFAVGLCVPDLSASLAELQSRGLAAQSDGQLAWLAVGDRAGVNLVLREAGPSVMGVPDHAFPLRRLDHLASVTLDLDAKAHFWAETLGVRVAGEVRTPTLVIRQLRMGDAVLELLGAAAPDSPIHQRPAGLIGMASWEVPDVEQAVVQARQAGLSVSDAGPGPLPGTRIATVAGAELAGVNMQLLQYV